MLMVFIEVKIKNCINKRWLRYHFNMKYNVYIWDVYINFHGNEILSYIIAFNRNRAHRCDNISTGMIKICNKNYYCPLNYFLKYTTLLKLYGLQIHFYQIGYIE